jgi:hypothetical protein
MLGTLETGINKKKSVLKVQENIHVRANDKLYIPEF